MAVWVYKGEAEELIDPKFLRDHLNSGWSVTKDEVEEDSETDDQELESLKAEAKEKNIKGYGRMSVETLKERLGYGD